jgi:hypothetical protein
MMSRIHAASIVIVTLTAGAAQAAPDQLCVPDAGSPAPQWWNPGLTPKAKEARWSGALVRKKTAGGRSARMRALFGPAEQTVYFELAVSGDPSLDAAHDAVLLGLGDEAGALPELFVSFSPIAACPDAAACAGDGVPLDASAIQFAEAIPTVTSLGWGALTETNPSADFFIDHPWVRVSELAGVYTWTLSFALVVPVDAAGDIRPDLRIYGNGVAYHPGWTSGTYTELPVMCTSSSVTSDDCLIGVGFLTDLPGDLPYQNMDDTWSVLRSDCVALSLQ